MSFAVLLLMFKQLVLVGIQTNYGSFSVNCCTLQFVIKFMHVVRSATQLPIKRMWEVFKIC